MRDGSRIQLILTGLLLFMIEVATLCLPALVNRGPLIYPDTRAYFLGGRVAVEKAERLLEPHGTAKLATAMIEGQIKTARGVRSAFYSLFTYIPTVTVSLWLVVLLQASFVALILRLAFRLVCPTQTRWRSTVFIVLLAFTSCVSFVASLIMPDVFTPIMAISVIIVLLFWDRLKISTRLGLLATIAGSVVMHITNLPIAVGLMAAGALTQRRELWPLRRRYVLVSCALGLGLVAMLSVGVVGFHEWSITPQAPPFLLARSIQDGPARLYLQEHCPQAGFDMCRHLDKLDLNTSTFLWDKKNGLYSAVSPEEEADLRAEGNRIYLAAAVDHPVLQAIAMLRNTWHQLVWFMLHEYNIPSSATYNVTDMKLDVGDQLPWQTYLSILEYLFTLFGLAYILLAWRNTKQVQQHFLLLVLATVLLSAVAGAFSEPAPRYEARVIWLIPMTALLFAFELFDKRYR
jgi:hypothetical protein